MSGVDPMVVTFFLTPTDAMNLDAMCTEGYRKLRDDCTEEARGMALAVLRQVEDATKAVRAGTYLGAYQKLQDERDRLLAIVERRDLDREIREDRTRDAAGLD